MSWSRKIYQLKKFFGSDERYDDLYIAKNCNRFYISTYRQGVELREMLKKVNSQSIETAFNKKIRWFLRILYGKIASLIPKRELPLHLKFLNLGEEYLSKNIEVIVLDQEFEMICAT